MAQLAKRLPCKHKDQSLISKTPLTKEMLSMVAHTCHLRKKRRTNPWLGLLGDLQARERLCLRNGRWHLKNTRGCSPGLHMYEHTRACAPQHI